MTLEQIEDDDPLAEDNITPYPRDSFEVESRQTLAAWALKTSLLSSNCRTGMITTMLLVRPSQFFSSLSPQNTVGLENITENVQMHMHFSMAYAPSSTTSWPPSTIIDGNIASRSLGLSPSLSQPLQAQLCSLVAHRLLLLLVQPIS
jgi:hypothetical protein